LNISNRRCFSQLFCVLSLYAKKLAKTAGPVGGPKALNSQKKHCGYASSTHFVNVRFWPAHLIGTLMYLVLIEVAACVAAPVRRN